MNGNTVPKSMSLKKLWRLSKPEEVEYIDGEIWIIPNYQAVPY